MSAMGFGKHGPGCACCKGPAAWSALIPSLAPLAPTASIDTLVVSATNQPKIVKSNSRWDWLRLPNWALPTRPVPLISDDDDSPVPLDAILAGRTKSPIRVEDFRAFVRNDAHANKDSSRALEFLLTYNQYRAAFFALPPEKQAPHPFAALQSQALANKAAEIQSRFPLGLPSGPAPPRVAAQPVNPTQAYPHLDPDRQPLRQELQNIIDLYLQPHSLSPVTSLVSSNILHQALSEAKLTTHPSALDPVASNVHSHLTTEILPRFLDHAVSNLSAATSRGRMLIACIAFAAALVLEVFLIMYRTGRPARLLAMPLWVLAIGYAIGSQTGLCFWLALRGTREHKSYEVDTSSSSPKKTSFNTPVAGKQPPRPPALLSRLKLSMRKTSQTPDRPRTMAEKGELPPLPVDDPDVVDEKRHSRNSLSVGSRNSFTLLVEHKEDGIIKKIMRLTGTAVDTIAVEDSRVRKLQALVGARVAIWLILGTSMVIGIVMAIP